MLNLKFETITPLHISNGNQLAYNLDYIITDNEFAKLNWRAHQELARRKLFDFRRNYNFNEIVELIEQNKEIFGEECFEYKVEIVDSFEKFLDNERRNGKKIVQEFVNSNGKFYVPGSSVKGMLTTILNRDPDKNPLGINPNKASIDDKFVITDSEFLDADDFVVDVAFRPPSVNLIVLDINKTFTCQIRKGGNLSIKELKEKLASYSHSQLDKAIKIVEKFKKMEKKPGGATQYYNFLQRFVNGLSLDDEEYLVNLGFGGGSYFKIYSDVKIPKYRNPGRKGRQEEAHTTFAVNIDNEFFQLGWCKLTIEEE